MSSPSAVAAGMRELTFAQAVNEALAEELRRDPTVFVIGEDVAEAGTPFKVLSGLVEEFGTGRVIDSPISEAGIAGIGLGAASANSTPASISASTSPAIRRTSSSSTSPRSRSCASRSAIGSRVACQRSSSSCER